MLSGMQHLTGLKLWGAFIFQPGTLAALTQLQHLKLVMHHVLAGAAAGVAQLLPVAQRQHLQQLTHLCLRCSYRRATLLQQPSQR